MLYTAVAVVAVKSTTQMWVVLRWFGSLNEDDEEPVWWCRGAVDGS